MRTFVDGFLAAYRSGAVEGAVEPPVGWAGQRLGILYVTPGFTESRHLVALVVNPRGRPVAVIKTPRKEWDDQGVLHEANALRELAWRAPGLAGAVPEVLASTHWQGRPVLLESALVGRPLTHAVVRRHPKVVDRVLRHLAALPDVEVLDGQTLRRSLLDPALARLRDLAPVGHPLIRAAERTSRVLDDLDDASFPSPFEHGDPSHPNLLLLTDGRAGLVDWELARPRGAPGHDLVSFLTFVTLARRRAHGLEAERPALGAGLLDPTSDEYQRYLEGLNERGVSAQYAPALLLLSLARSALRLLDRLDPVDHGAHSQAEVNLVRRFGEDSVGGRSERLSSGELLRRLEVSRNAGLWIHGVQLMTRNGA